MCVCLCAQDRKRTSREREIGREGEARINTKPSGGLLLPEREREQDTQQRVERERVIESERHESRGREEGRDGGKEGGEMDGQ